MSPTPVGATTKNRRRSALRPDAGRSGNTFGVSETERRDGLPGPIRPRQPHDFDTLYNAGTPPWDIGRPQPAFLGLADAGAIRGRVLDVGCGTGEHVLMAAASGLDATGVDVAATAITIAERKAAERGLVARFLVHDALELAALKDSFDTVVDCGLFHIFEDHDRPRFVDGLRAVTRVGGHYHMLCFSELQPGDWGPRRVTQDEIRASFSDGWRVDAIDPAKLDITIDPSGAVAWLATITRI